MMVDALNKKGYNGFLISVPSSSEFLTIIALAAPVFVTMISKVRYISQIEMQLRSTCLKHCFTIHLHLLGGFLLSPHICRYIFGHIQCGSSPG